MRKRRQKVDRLVHAIGALDHPLEQFISLLVNSVEVAIRWVQMRISDNCASRCEELFQDFGRFSIFVFINFVDFKVLTVFILVFILDLFWTRPIRIKTCKPSSERCDF